MSGEVQCTGVGGQASRSKPKPASLPRRNSGRSDGGAQEEFRGAGPAGFALRVAHLRPNQRRWHGRRCGNSAPAPLAPRPAPAGACRAARQACHGAHAPSKPLQHRGSAWGCGRCRRRHRRRRRRCRRRLCRAPLLHRALSPPPQTSASTSVPWRSPPASSSPPRPRSALMRWRGRARRPSTPPPPPSWCSAARCCGPRATSLQAGT